MVEQYKNLKAQFCAIDSKYGKYANFTYYFGLFFFILGRALGCTFSAYSFYVIVFLYIGILFLFFSGIYRLCLYYFKNRKLFWAALSVLVLGFVFYFFSCNSDFAPIVALAIVGAINLSSTKILLIGILSNLVVIINNIIVTLFGMNYSKAYDSNDFFYLGDDYFRFRIFNNFTSTDFAAHYFWIIAAYIWIRGLKITWGEVVALGALDALIYSLTGSSTTLVCLSLLFLITLTAKTIYLVRNNKHNRAANSITSVIKRIFVLCTRYSFVVFSLFSVILALFYSTNNPLLYHLNNILHYRLGLGHRAITEYGIHLFTHSIAMYGADSSYDGFYNFVDCSYLYILIVNGLIPFVFYIISMTAIQIRHKKYILGIILLTVCALSCVEEHHLSEINYNFFILLLFADLEIDRRTICYDQVSTQKSFSNTAMIMSALFTIAIVAVNIPRFEAMNDLNRLDQKSYEIYQAIQDNLDDKVEIGEWLLKTSAMSSAQYGQIMTEPEDFKDVTGLNWESIIANPKDHLFFYIYYDNHVDTSDSILDILITDKVKTLVGNGSIIIEYDVQTGKVYSIWYSESYNCSIIQETGARTLSRMARLADYPQMEGYSTGD